MSNTPPAFQKDPEAESFLARLNALLAPHQEAEYAPRPEVYPTLFIIGAPRSGTTLLYQLLATHLNVGYISNLAAAFWQAPVYGIRLHQKLLPARQASDFTSAFGRTHGLNEPHEFGYFWADVLQNKALRYPTPDARGQVDWPRFKQVLLNMAHAFGGPACYKVSMLGWYATQVMDLLDRACFIRIRRNPVDAALSLLAYRQNMHGAVDAWVSLKPEAYDTLRTEPAAVQVAGQVYHLEEEMGKPLSRADPERVLEVSYHDLCTQPGAVLAQAQALLARNGHHPTSLFTPPASFPYVTYTPQTHPAYERVAEAVHRFYAP